MLFQDQFLSWLPLDSCLFWFFCWCPGGKEGVLVVWQLDTGKKKFLPRIGSPLLCFTDSPDPALSSVRKILLYWNSELFCIKVLLSLLKQNQLISLIYWNKVIQISCADNLIHMLEMPSMDILKTISGIKVCSKESLWNLEYLIIYIYSNEVMMRILFVFDWLEFDCLMNKKY